MRRRRSGSQYYAIGHCAIAQKSRRDFGGGNYVVLNGTGSRVSVSGLTAGERYRFQVFEYNQNIEPERVTLNQPKTVCVPSTKEIVEPPPAPCSPIEDGEFGLCRAIIGWGIDARTGECAAVSGCGCDERCEGRDRPARCA